MAFLAAGLAAVLVAVFLTVFVVDLVAVLVAVLVTGLEAVFLVAAAFFAGLVFLTGDDLLVGAANLVLTFLADDARLADDASVPPSFTLTGFSPQSSSRS